MTLADSYAPEINSLEINASRLFSGWLKQQKASLAFTTYQAGKLFFIGLRPDGNLSVFERSFSRGMGLGIGPDKELWLSSLYQLWKFENFLEAGETHDGHDALYVPITGHTTGDIDVHDIHCGVDGRPIFVATRFNCLATPSDKGSFEVVWHPPFIDRIAAEDRCHLNGYAMVDGVPRYATCVAESNVFDGWRDGRADGGIVIDIETNTIIASGLSMPHSPRFYRDKLWLIQSGTGEFGHVDLPSGKFIAACFLPGFARGMAFMGDYAIVGVSKPRENRTFDGLILNERLKKEKVEPVCHLAVIHLKTGDVEHRLTMEGVVQELYDVVAIPETIRPKALGFKTDEIRFAVKPVE